MKFFERATLLGVATVIAVRIAIWMVMAQAKEKR